MSWHCFLSTTGIIALFPVNCDMKYLLFLIGALACLGQSLAQTYLLVGTYTNKGSKGIYVYRFDTATANSEMVSVTEAVNPSFLTVSPDLHFVYAVNETDTGTISSYRFDSSGKLQFINQQPTMGRHPCHVTTGGGEFWVIAGNYSSGNFNLYRTDEGRLTPALQTVQHTGGSINTQRQQGPHVHNLLTRWHPGLYVADLGTDEIRSYRFYWKDGLRDTAAAQIYKCTPGSGPRHLSMHPNGKYLYVMEELSGTVAVLKRNKKGRLKAHQRISSHPAAYAGVIGSADIHVSPDGKFLYASNRGESNTLAIFVIVRRGRLQLLGHQSTLGIKPRNFNFSPGGNYLLVANQESDEIVVFKRDTSTGLLTDTGKRIKVPTPVCLQWVER